jgi:hypothetical protein
MEAVVHGVEKLSVADDVVAPGDLVAFLNAEREGAVLRLRRGFCGSEAEAEQVCDHARRWLKHVAPSARGVWDKTDGTVAPSRLHREDVIRTFATEEHRAALLEFVVRLQQALGDYSQAMCFVAAYFSLFLSRSRAFELVWTLAQSDVYVGHRWWDRVAFGTEAFAFHELLAEHDPEVAAHLERLYVLPEAYTQRWFLALGVNVLPYAHLIGVTDAFLDQGVVVLHRLGLAIVRVCRAKILAAKETGQIIAILSQPPEESCAEIAKLAAAERHGVLLNAAQLQQFRDLALAKHRDRLVPKEGQDSTRKHTGETDSEDEESDAEDNPECLQCGDNMAELYCAQCNVLVCGRCHKKSKKGHDKAHAVEATDQWPFDKLVALYLKLKK